MANNPYSSYGGTNQSDTWQSARQSNNDNQQSNDWMRMLMMAQMSQTNPYAVLGLSLAKLLKDNVFNRDNDSGTSERTTPEGLVNRVQNWDSLGDGTSVAREPVAGNVRAANIPTNGNLTGTTFNPENFRGQGNVASLAPLLGNSGAGANAGENVGNAVASSLGEYNLASSFPTSVAEYVNQTELEKLLGGIRG